MSVSVQMQKGKDDQKEEEEEGEVRQRKEGREGDRGIDGWMDGQTSVTFKYICAPFQTTNGVQPSPAHLRVTPFPQ